MLPGLACGCSETKPPPAPPISLSPTVKVVHAQYQTVKRTVEQPGVISAYERTALYAKVSGFVRKWNVDIGDRVKKGATLVELFAPELVEQHRQMEAQVKLDRALVTQAHKLHVVAQHNVTAATKQVDQARAEVKSYAAIVKRWDGEVTRLTAMVAKQVVDVEVLSETTRQLESSQALLEASQVAVLTRDAQRLAAEATVERTVADIGTADARVPVAIAEERRLAALVDYLTINAPYDGVVLRATSISATLCCLRAATHRRAPFPGGVAEPGHAPVSVQPHRPGAVRHRRARGGLGLRRRGEQRSRAGASAGELTSSRRG